jgi:hypothetical protein
MDEIERKIVLAIDKLGISYFQNKRKEFESNPLYNSKLDRLFFDPSTYSILDEEIQVVLIALNEDGFIEFNDDFVTYDGQEFFEQLYLPFQMDFKSYCLNYQVRPLDHHCMETSVGLLEKFVSKLYFTIHLSGSLWEVLHPIQTIIEDYVKTAISMGGKSISNIISNIIIKIEALINSRFTNKDWQEIREVYKYYLEKLEVEAHKRYSSEISVEVYSESTSDKLEFGISKVALVSLIDLLLKCDILPNQKAALQFCYEHFSFKDGKKAKAVSIGTKRTLTSLHNDVTNKKDMGGFYDIKEMLLGQLSKIPDRPKNAPEDA